MNYTDRETLQLAIFKHRASSKVAKGATTVAARRTLVDVGHFTVEAVACAGIFRDGCLMCTQLYAAG